MSKTFDGLIDRTVKLAQDFLGDIVGGTFARARRAIAKQATTLAVGVSGLILAMVFGALAAHAWLKTVTDKSWAPPLVVAGIAGIVGLVACARQAAEAEASEAPGARVDAVDGRPAGWD